MARAASPQHAAAAAPVQPNGALRLPSVRLHACGRLSAAWSGAHAVCTGRCQWGTPGPVRGPGGSRAVGAAVCLQPARVGLGVEVRRGSSVRLQAIAYNSQILAQPIVQSNERTPAHSTARNAQRTGPQPQAARPPPACSEALRLVRSGPARATQLHHARAYQCWHEWCMCLMHVYSFPRLNGDQLGTNSNTNTNTGV